MTEETTKILSLVDAYNIFIGVDEKKLDVTYITDEGTINFRRCNSTMLRFELVSLVKNIWMVDLYNEIYESKKFSHVHSPSWIPCGKTTQIPFDNTLETLTDHDRARMLKRLGFSLSYLLMNECLGATEEVILSYIEMYPEDLNKKDDTYGLNPLMIACSKDGNQPVCIIKSLIKHGSDINAVSNDQSTALIKALMRNPPVPDVVSELIRAGARVDPIGDGPCPLYLACHSKDNIQLLVEAGANTRYLGKSGRGVLFWFILYNFYNLVTFKYLLTLDVDIYHRDNNGLNVLDYCLGVDGREGYCRLLIERNVGCTFSKLSSGTIEKYIKLIKS